jgi:sugar phosphate isomerase/epimerase
MGALDRRAFLQLGAAGTLLSSLSPVRADPAVQTPGFGLGLVTYNVAANWDLKTLLGVCKSVGIAAVEFRTTHKHGVEPTLTREQRKDVKKRCADAGVVPWGCGTTCEFQAPDANVVKAQIETCKRFIDLVADIGGRGVKVRPNGLPAGVPVPRTLEQIGKSLIPCGQAADNAGVEIWVEVHGRGTAEPEHMKTIMEHCNHKKVGICWNSNAQDLSKGSVAPAFQMLSHWLLSCHINDLWKDSAGVYPYRELFGLLRKHGYDRYTLCEVGRIRPDPTLGADWLRYYKALWQELSRG